MSNEKTYTKKTKFAFGKYKGETVGTVMKSNTNYVIWCLENVDGFSVNKTVQQDIDAFRIKQAEKKIQKQRRDADYDEEDDNLPWDHEDFH